MRLSNEAIIVLNILSVKPCYLKELIELFQALDSKIHKNYHSLRTSVVILIGKLMEEQLIKREGNRRYYIYSITAKGLQYLIRTQLKSLITL